jgi:predicted membrane-bound spermidine synthase
MRTVLIAVFVLSGAAGLIYESIWARYLGLFVGHSAYAQILVLGVFLGGMALGAAATARRAESIARPLWWYAIIEAAVGLIGLFFHEIFGVVTALSYDTVLPALSGGAVTIAKWVIAAVLILPQSVLLGATFPLMSAGALRLERRQRGADATPGRTLSLLYFANSLGAAGGVLIGGFVLVRLAGLPGTLVAAAMTNFVVALLVLVIARDVADDTATAVVGDDAPVAPPALSALADPRLPRALLVIAFGTAVASFIYEIAWIRMLSLVLGSATHAFELMLSAFILGLALGALWLRTRADTFTDPVRTLGIVQWTMGVMALATVPIYLASFDWTADLLRALGRTDEAYRSFNFVRYAVCLIVMLPATFCAGMTLPLITRTLMAIGGGERAIGTVYAVNTLGSIIGAALAGLVMLPLIGVKGTLVLGGAMDMALGVWLVFQYRAAIPGGARLLRITAIGSAVIVANVVFTQQFDRGVLTSGVYRYGVAPAAGARAVDFYRDGRTATVSMRSDASGTRSLATNGKPDASLTREWLQPPAPGSLPVMMGGDQVTQAFLPLITLAHAPQAKRHAVIGFGSGVSSHILLGSPHAEQVATIEIEPSMVDASRLFRPANERVYMDPRSSVVIDDAKAYFASSGNKFDLILSEPSNPWVSGVSGLFTDEFYQRVRTYLAPRGVFGQWLHLYEIDDPLVLSVIAAVHRNFPSYEIYFTSTVDILIVASNEPALPAADWSVLSYAGIARDLAPFRTITPDLMEALRLGGRQAFAPLLDGNVSHNSDYYPVLDLGAERTRFQRAQAEGIIALGVDRFPLGLVLSGYRTGFADATVSAVQIRRSEARALGAALRSMIVPPDTGTSFDALRRARHTLGQLRTLSSTGRAPESWELWVGDVLEVDEIVHGGTAGVADDAWFAELRQYATKAAAPERVLVSIDFLRALHAWDWPTVASTGERLMVLGATPPVAPMPAELLRNALVVAKLRLGDANGARRVFDAITPRIPRPDSDARRRLLEAWVVQAEAATTPVPPLPR